MIMGCRANPFTYLKATLSAWRATDRPPAVERERLDAHDLRLFLAGIMHQSSGNAALAEDCFHKTLYLDGSHEDALLALSILSDQRGERDQADQYRRSALRAIARKESP